MKGIIGIDPGRFGAVCILGDSGPIFEPLPYTVNELNYHKLFHWLKVFAENQSIEHVFLEKAQTMPRQGIVSAFNYGAGYGGIVSILQCLELRYSTVSPHAWTKIMHEGISTKLDAKEKSLLKIRQLYPALNLKRTERCRTDDEGFIDAILIAEYGRLKLSGKTL